MYSSGLKVQAIMQEQNKEEQGKRGETTYIYPKYLSATILAQVKQENHELWSQV